MRHAIPKSTPLTTPQVLLVPTTEVLLNSKDRETNTRYADLAGSEEFLASHVLRVPGASGASDGGKNAGNVRESKGKAKQYSTVNGRTVVVKDAFVYSNKGFKTLNQAQLLSDVIFFPDTADGQQWLVYYISKPLIGSFEALPIIPASIASTEEQERRAKQRHGNVSEAGSSSPSQSPKKKEIKDFSDLLGQFPMIARQMQPGLEKIFKEFSQQFDKPITKRHSRTPSVSSERSSSSLADSLASLRSSLADSDTLHPSSLALDPDEDAMRFALESAITTAIDLFQGVDRQQLSLLGATTDLSGPLVERLIERYVAEQLHDMVLFPRICSIRRPEDMSLESNIRKMTDIDIAQVGIPIECGMQGKRELALRLENGIAAFKKMGVASSPQEMVDILLATQKAVTVAQSLKGTPQETENSVEKQSLAMTVNADVLVSMLLIVVIRSGVRHMHARLSYMRHFIFIDDVESGETGYALSTFEAVLAYLSSDSSALRRASRRNSKLWEATRNGDLTELRSILEPGRAWLENADVTEEPEPSEDMSDEASDVSHSDLERGPEEPFSDLGELPPDRMSMRGGDFAAVGGSLAHVFPFQKPPTPPPESAPPRVKRVTMAALRSASLSSGYSSRSHSRTKSMDSGTSAMSDGDTSIDKLAQTQGHGGDSLLMMAVEAGQLQCLQYLLSLQGHFPIEMVLDDCNSSGTTLLSAAIQGDDKNLTNYLLHHIIKNTPSEERLRQYFSRQDNKGRCFAHYLFNQPHLMDSIGEKIPWTLKDKNGQTPLFALCRSYDHEEYRWMVEKALSLASMTQGDHEPLHLDDHVDVKGNTLLHIVADQPVMMKLLQNCDSDVNAANDKRFTPIMVASKYGRFDLVRALFSDPRVEMQARDIRGLTAVELAKDDEVRNRIDDLVLLSTPPAADGRITTVVRSFFVDDATIRLVLKSGGPNANGTITVTTCRRSVTDFENLAKWLSIEQPASWLPTNFNLPSPFLIPSKPSRALLRDIQLRLDDFLRNLLSHTTFSTHEMVWEFFLVPDIDPSMLAERSKRKAEIRVENLRDDFLPVTMPETREIELFISHAKDQMRALSTATRTLVRRTNTQRMAFSDLASAATLASTALSTLPFLPRPYTSAFDKYATALVPTASHPLNALYYALASISSSTAAILTALTRPSHLIGSMAASQRAIDRHAASLSRQNRWTPNIGLFDDARRAMAADAASKADKARAELETLGAELRYTQTTVAAELAGWQEGHVRQGREVLRSLARGMVVRERARLEGMRRALREVRKGEV